MTSTEGLCPSNTKPLPEGYREVLAYLVAEEQRVQQSREVYRQVYCWAAGKNDLYTWDLKTGERVRIDGCFLYTTLKAMENRSLVTRHTRHEQAIRGPRRRYTVAMITEDGRRALDTGRIPKDARKAKIDE